jgi:hypothetical protein
MPSCKSSDSARVKPWLAHTPQPDPPPDQPGEPDVPPIGDPPEQPGEVPHAGPWRPASSYFQFLFARAFTASSRRRTTLTDFMY